jgi:signal transduction histidine kinase
VSDEKLVVSCRPGSLKRALNNIIQNAITYGGGARLALTATPESAVITIDDDGPGIPEADLERMFEPFARGEISRNRETGGSGLGLAIARSVIRAHGGVISMANRDKGGLRVKISLPNTRR